MEIELRPGTLLGSYQLLVRIGRGGMASVWVARDCSPGAGKNRLVALKAMLPELANSSDFRAMFLEEGGIVRSIEHPNVVRVHEVGEDLGILYLAMEWVEGDSLRTLVREAGKGSALPLPIAVRVIADTAAGLHAAHELRGWDGELRNIVHCDISPHNILLGSDGVAKLVDFGVANATVHSDFGMAERVKGKLGYMSPEQARQEPIDRRSDVFALGIVLYELTTGSRLFQGESAAHTLTLVQAAEVMDLEKTLPGFPPELASIVKKALARDRDKRFHTALELHEALDGYLSKSGVAVTRAHVGGLVQRVLGARITGLRQQLDEALANESAPERTGSRTSLPAAAASPAVAATRLLSEPPRANEISGGALTSTPRPETYELAPARPEIFPWVFAAAGIAAAIGSIVYVSRPSMDEAPIVVQAQMSAVRPKAAAAPRELPRQEPVEEAAGVDIGSIPLAAGESPKAAGRAVAQAAVTEPSRVARPSQDKPTTEKVVLAEEPQIVLEESVENPYRAAPSAEPPSVAKSAAPAPVSPGPAEPSDDQPRGPFNRGQALSQLSASARRASACRKSGGPSGSGRATITFGNDGAARGVVVSAPFAGTPVGACVASAFKGSRVPPYTGSQVTLPWSFRVAE